MTNSESGMLESLAKEFGLWVSREAVGLIVLALIFGTIWWAVSILVATDRRLNKRAEEFGAACYASRSFSDCVSLCRENYAAGVTRARCIRPTFAETTHD